MIKCIDEIAPIEQVSLDTTCKVKKPTTTITQKINKRKRLLQSDKKNKSTTNAPVIKLLNAEIKNYFANIKLQRVKRAALGPSVNLWKAVKLAKNLCPPDFPQNLTLGVTR